MTTTTPGALPLRNGALADLPDRVAAPGYDRSALVPAVVHIGVGGFARAHPAVYLDDLARRGETEWGLVGVGLRSPEMGEVLAEQDGLYVVVERGTEPDRARVVGIMTDYLYGPDGPEAVLEALADERTRVVTLTITGSGYRIDPNSGEFDADDDLLQRDLEDPGAPATVFGYLVEALERRRAAGLPPFTVLSCDNMQDNGTAARTAVVSFARLRDEGLAAWIEENGAFPSSMVDRITPSTTPEERDRVVRDLGVDDRWPVITEPYRQWVVQDTFACGRPALDEVGVQLVADVHPYGLMKTRMLNASHCAIGYLGYLAGYRTTDEVMADPPFAAFLDRLMSEEVAPLLPEVAGMDADDYRASILERLANPKMGDQLQRLCRRGSTKIPNYLLPSIRSALDQDRPHDLLVLAVAGWMRFLRGYDYAGQEVPVEGPLRDRLMPLAQEGGDDPHLLLNERRVFGDLADDPRFVTAVTAGLRALAQQGPREAVERYLAQRGVA
ncbi:MAG: mannitol dehydrogenase family protein [Actinomycetota bacterium]|nr:mannitol dehydrogenase family protein [Actinomycetota bacterium]